MDFLQRIPLLLITAALLIGADIAALVADVASLRAEIIALKGDG